MINTNELRIGNYVGYDGRVLTVDGVGQDYTICFKNFDGFKSKWIQTYNSHAILVTEEWLLKLGLSNTVDPDIQAELDEMDADFLVFFDDDGKFSVELTPTTIGFNYTVSLYESVIDEDGNYAAKGTHEFYYDELHVHTLQNLYYATQGIELTIKP